MSLKSILLILAALCALISCKGEKTELKTLAKTEARQAPGFKALKHINKALILGNSLPLFNKDMSHKSKVSGLYGLVVDLDSISQKRFALGKIDDECQEYNFAYANSLKIKGWIHGNHVYQYLHDDRDTVFTLQGTEFRLYATKTLNIGVTDNGDLTFCGGDNPIVLYNSKFKKEAFVPMVVDTVYNSEYMVLDAHDGWADKITDAKLKGDKLIFRIHREYQEGSADFDIEIEICAEGYQGRVLKVTKHDAE